MSEHSAVAVFATVEQANAALQNLVSRGVLREHVTVVSRELESKQEVHGLVSGSDQDTTGGVTGALGGAAIGLLLGGAIMAVVRLTPMGINFGWPLLMGCILGFVLAGAVFGGLIGGMTGRGIKEANILPYDEQVKAGRALVIAHGKQAEMNDVQSILRAAGALETKLHHHVTAPADMTEAV